jgi:hypothetical protein
VSESAGEARGRLRCGGGAVESGSCEDDRFPHYPSCHLDGSSNGSSRASSSGDHVSNGSTTTIARTSHDHPHRNCLPTDGLVKRVLFVGWSVLLTRATMKPHRTAPGDSLRSSAEPWLALLARTPTDSLRSSEEPRLTSFGETPGDSLRSHPEARKPSVCSPPQPHASPADSLAAPGSLASSSCRRPLEWLGGTALPFLRRSPFAPSGDSLRLRERPPGANEPLVGPKVRRASRRTKCGEARKTSEASLPVVVLATLGRPSRGYIAGPRRWLTGRRCRSSPSDSLRSPDEPFVRFAHEDPVRPCRDSRSLRSLGSRVARPRDGARRSSR